MVRAVRALPSIWYVYESDSCIARRAREEAESVDAIYVPNGSTCPNCPENVSPLANANKQHGCKLTTCYCSCNENWTVRQSNAVDSRPSHHEIEWGNWNVDCITTPMGTRKCAGDQLDRSRRPGRRRVVGHCNVAGERVRVCNAGASRRTNRRLGFNSYIIVNAKADQLIINRLVRFHFIESIQSHMRNMQMANVRLGNALATMGAENE